jgi:homoserine kinase
MKIVVPASTANLGAGFDSIGLALNLYLTLEVKEAEQWEVVPLSKELKVFPTDESHMIVRIAKEIAKKHGKELNPCHTSVRSDIPLARGLGSSAAAVVAGIELADAVGELRLTLQEKLDLATKLEGHPDNVGASLYGGLVVSCQTKDTVRLLPISDLPIEVITIIPEKEWKTEDSRSALPSMLSFPEAVEAGAVSNVMVAALLKKDWELVGEMMKADQYHQPYRKKFIPHYEEVEQIACRYGAFGVALSGAGPTIACYVEKESSKWLYTQLSQAFPKMNVQKLQISPSGIQTHQNDKKVRPSLL